MTAMAAAPASRAPGLAEFTAVHDSVVSLARSFDPASLTATSAAALIGVLAETRHALAAVERLAAARVADTGAWRSSATSAEAWLARSAGTTAAQAREELATARRLAALPEVDAAARAGALSPGQAAAVAGAAAANPDAAPALLATAAEEPLGVLREECLKVKAAADPDPMATWARQRASRSMIRRTDGDGMAVLLWRTTADERGRFDAVIDPIIDEIFTAARRAGRRESRDAYASDAMAELARRATTTHATATTTAAHPANATAATAATGPAAAGSRPVTATGPAAAGPAAAGPARATVPGENEPAGSSATPAAPTTAAGARRSAERFLALLRVDAAALQRGHLAGGEVCEIPGVGPVPVQVARELLGEAVLKLVITRGVDVTTTCSLGRGPTAAMRIAKMWEQPLCIVAGCPNRAGLEYDHDIPVAAGGPTTAANFNRPCSRHHDLKSHQRWDLVPGTGRRPMVPPDDPRHPRHKPPPRANAP